MHGKNLIQRVILFGGTITPEPDIIFLREDNYDYLLDFKTGEKYEVDKQADDLINAASCAVIHQNIPDWPYMTYIDPEALNLYGLYLVDGKLESRLITEINRSAFPAPLFFRKIDFMN